MEPLHIEEHGRRPSLLDEGLKFWLAHVADCPVCQASPGLLRDLGYWLNRAASGAAPSGATSLPVALTRSKP